MSLNVISEKRKRGKKALHFSAKPLPQILGLVGVLALEDEVLFSYIEDDIIPVVAMLTGLGLRGPDSLILTEAVPGVSVPLIALGERPENLGHKWPSQLVTKAYGYP